MINKVNLRWQVDLAVQFLSGVENSRLYRARSDPQTVVRPEVVSTRCQPYVDTYIVIPLRKEVTRSQVSTLSKLVVPMTVSHEENRRMRPDLWMNASYSPLWAELRSIFGWLPLIGRLATKCLSRFQPIMRALKRSNGRWQVSASSINLDRLFWSVLAIFLSQPKPFTQFYASVCPLSIDQPALAFPGDSSRKKPKSIWWRQKVTGQGTFQYGCCALVVNNSSIDATLCTCWVTFLLL